MKHKVSLSDEEIKILVASIESAGFYPDDLSFFDEIRRLKKRLQKLLDFKYVNKKSIAGRKGYWHLADNVYAGKTDLRNAERKYIQMLKEMIKNER